MTNWQIVSRLRDLGYKVGVYVRNDGSIRVVSLNGVKYSSRLSQGVQAARNLYYSIVGIEGERDRTRYESSKLQRTAARFSKKSGDTLRSQSAEFQKEYKRFQNEVRKFNKQLAKEGKKPRFFVNWETTRQGARRGNISVEQQIRRARDYFNATSRGVAPFQMVQELLDKLVIVAPRFPELQNFIDFIEPNRNNLDIYETRATLDWLYGYVKEIKQSETWQERLHRLKVTVHTSGNKNI